MRLLAIAWLLATASACGQANPVQGDPVTGRPLRPSTLACLVSDHLANPVNVDALPGTVSDVNGVTLRLAAQPIGAPGPAPFDCGLASPHTIAFEDAEGHRWWILYSIVQGGIDLTPALDQASGAMAVTWVVQRSFTRFSSFSVEDSKGLLVAANMGGLLLSGDDAGGLATTRGADLGPTFQGDCGRTREVTVLFSGAGTAALRPGEIGSLSLGASAVKVWNVDAYTWVGTPQCTDLTPLVSTLAWRAATSLSQTRVSN